MSVGVINLTLSGPVARITIHRPDKCNALALEHWAALEAALEQVRASSTSVLVLSGCPGAFSAGADIDELGQMLDQPARFVDSNALVQRTQLTLQRLAQTTLAVIDGVCVGGGLGLALACDLRLASERSRFAITPAKLGLVYSADDSRRLVQAVGMARARELLLTGRLIDARTAADWGLVNQLTSVESLDAAQADWEKRLRTTSGQARRGIKTVLAHLGGDVQAGPEAAEAAFHDAFSSDDFAEGAAAFLDKRMPSFR